MRRKVEVERIDLSGDEGMSQATIGLPEHGACIIVIGHNLTECIRRTMVVVDAFEAKEKAKC